MRRGWVFLGGVILLALALAAGGWMALGHAPDFYLRALAADPASQAVASTEMFNRAQRLARQVRDPGEWQAQFTAEQINGYLAVDLVKQFPELAAPEIRDPRVELRAGAATLAFRYDGPPASSVVSLEVEAYLFEPSVVALRICGARAGALPLPLDEVLESISRAAAAADVNLRWRQTEGDPVALVTFESPPGKPQLAIEKLELRDGSLFVAGKTAPKRLKPPSASVGGESFRRPRVFDRRRDTPPTVIAPAPTPFADSGRATLEAARAGHASRHPKRHQDRRRVEKQLRLRRQHGHDHGQQNRDANPPREARELRQRQPQRRHHDPQPHARSFQANLNRILGRRWKHPVIGRAGQQNHRDHANGRSMHGKEFSRRAVFFNETANSRSPPTAFLVGNVL